ncbi:MAG: sulfite exporter TauE/SafE family protein [Thermomicrobiales bacterium]
MTVLEAIGLMLAAFGGGALNSVAGGGSFLTFPALIFAGIPPINANATSTVALWPGTVASVAAYRRELAQHRPLLLPLGLVSLIGGVLGALLLLNTPQATFTELIPWLLLVATLLLAFGGPAVARLRKRLGHSTVLTTRSTMLTTGLQFLVAIYGGYFGGGMGIVMLAALAVMGMEDIHAMNALKTLLASCINGVAVITFIVAGAIYWPEAIVMLVGAIAGGYGGAYYARKLDPKLVRRFTIAVGCLLTLYFFYRTYRP